MLAIAVLFVIYYFYVIPANRYDFHDRSNRILKTTATSFQEHVKVLQDAFTEALQEDRQSANGNASKRNSFLNKQDAYRELYENTHYKIERRKENKPLLIVDTEEGPVISYKIDTLGFSSVNVPLQEFADKLFGQRNELFDSYVLLLTNNPGNGDWVSWKLVYESSNLTNSNVIRIDSTQHRTCNSDNSGIIPVTIGGVDQMLFYQALSLNDQQLFIGGLLSKGKYKENLYSVPLSIIIPTIIVMILILIILPLLKIYFLSPNETLHHRDVIACNISIFMGTAAVLMILIFLYLFTLTSVSYRNRMHDLGKQIRRELKSQLDSASMQLDEYDSIYQHLPRSEKSLSRKASANTVDKQFYPKKFPHLKRLFWIDSKGNTTAKWSPYKYDFPLTNISQYDLFRQLKISGNNSNLIVSSGWSNVTGEFLVFIGKPLRLLASKPTESDTIGIALATSLHLNTYPVIPPGFGYCVIDREGNVIMRSDNRRLSENIFVETRYDPGLYNSIRFKTTELVKDVQLYGRSKDLVVYHVDGHPLSVVLYFERGRVIANISRFLHFTTTCLLLIFISTGLYIAYFTYRKRGPSKIKFVLDAQEWMRPSAANRYSYLFTRRYSIWMVLFNLVLFALLQWLHNDLRSILFLSLLLPLYTLLGIAIGRTSLAEGAGKKFWRSKQFKEIALLNAFLLLTANFLFIRSICQDPDSNFNFNLFLLIGAQLVYLVLTYFLHLNVERLRQKAFPIPPPDKPDVYLINHYYRKSIYGAVLLITVLPTYGITSYGYFAERLQHKKEKELVIASEFEAKYKYLNNDLRSTYKDNLRNLDSQYRPVSYLKTKGNYLSDHDTLLFTKPEYYPEKGPNLDGPYLFVSSELDHYTGSLLGRQVRQNWSSDSGKTWKFAAYNNSLVLKYRGQSNDDDTVWVSSSYQAPLLNFWSVFIPGGLVFIFIIGLFLYGCSYVIKSTLKRLFLLHFAGSANTSGTYLQLVFNSVPAASGIPGNLQELQACEQKAIDDGVTAQLENHIMQMTYIMTPLYEKIWIEQSISERFLLYDLAKDGYTNYKNPETIYSLINKGILKYSDFRLNFFSYSFRNFVIIKGNEPELQANFKQYSIGGVWHSLRMPVLLVIIALGVFFVMTQQKVAQDFTTVITSLLALVPLLTQLLSSRNPEPDPVAFESRVLKKNRTA